MNPQSMAPRPWAKDPDETRRYLKALGVESSWYTQAPKNPWYDGVGGDHRIPRDLLEEVSEEGWKDIRLAVDEIKHEVKDRR